MLGLHLKELGPHLTGLGPNVGGPAQKDQDLPPEYSHQENLCFKLTKFQMYILK